MPTEWPKQRVIALVRRNKRIASGVRNNGAPSSAARVIDPIHNDFAGAHRTSPLTAFTPGLAVMRAGPDTNSIAALLQSRCPLRVRFTCALSFFSGRETGQTF